MVIDTFPSRPFRSREGNCTAYVGSFMYIQKTSIISRPDQQELLGQLKPKTSDSIPQLASPLANLLTIEPI